MFAPMNSLLIKADYRHYRPTYNNRPFRSLTSRLYMDWISLPSGSSSINANMGEIQRYLGSKAHHIIGQYRFFCWIFDSCSEYQYQDVDCCESYSRNRRWWLDHIGQYLHQ
jgi:hypothetical protein